jgi:hypothetical protein
LVEAATRGTGEPDREASRTAARQPAGGGRMDVIQARPDHSAA